MNNSIEEFLAYIGVMISILINCFFIIERTNDDEKAVYPAEKIIKIDQVNYSPKKEDCIYFHRAQCTEKVIRLYTKEEE